MDIPLKVKKTMKLMHQTKYQIWKIPHGQP